MSRPLAVLTGASSGIGAALAPVLARDGYDLVLVARREDLLYVVADKVARDVPGARADAFALDLTGPDAAQRLVERAPASKLVVHSAGFGKIAPALAVDLDTYRRMIAINVSAVTEITYRFASKMAANGGGTIMNIASTAGFRAIPYFTVYAATKAYVVSFCEGLHYELRGRGVNVLAFCPGPTETEFISEAGADEMRDRGRHFFLKPERVAESVARAIRKRRESRVPGFLNNVAAFFQRHGPRGLVRWFSAKMFKPPGVI